MERKEEKIKYAIAKENLLDEGFEIKTLPMIPKGEKVKVIGETFDDALGERLTVVEYNDNEYYVSDDKLERFDLTGVAVIPNDDEPNTKFSFEQKMEEIKQDLLNEYKTKLKERLSKIADSYYVETSLANLYDIIDDTNI